MKKAVHMLALIALTTFVLPLLLVNPSRATTAIQENPAFSTSETSNTWYLAEGCTGPGFETWILVQNPQNTSTEVELTYLTSNGPVEGPTSTLTPHSRTSFNVEAHVANAWDVSTTVTSNAPVVAERAVYDSDRRWGHDSIGVKKPANTWYLAEGCTAEDFETWILVQNPGEDPASVTTSYMTPDGEMPGHSTIIPPLSRKTFNVAEMADGQWEVSTKVVSDVPVITERSMYGGSRTWGHDSIGTTKADTTWFMAEGCCGEGFETWILVQNPSQAEASVNLVYMTPDGPVSGPSEQLSANSRASFNVADHVPGCWDVSTKVESNIAVIAERSVYGNNRTWGHDSIGVRGSTFQTGEEKPVDRMTSNIATRSKRGTGPSAQGIVINGGHGSIGYSEDGLTWYLAEGCTMEGFETWVLVQNPNPVEAKVTLTCMMPNGAISGPTTSLDPFSRKSFNLYELIGEQMEVSTRVTSDLPVVSERSVYWGTVMPEPEPEPQPEPDPTPPYGVNLVSHVSYDDNIGNYWIDGVVRNDTSTSVKYVEIVATVHAADGTFLDSQTGYADLTVLDPGDSSSFTILFTPKPPGTSYYLISTAYDVSDTSRNRDVQLTALNHYRDDDGWFHVAGTLHNSSTTIHHEYVSLSLAYYDASGNLVCVETTFADHQTIPAGGDSSFSAVVYDETQASRIASYEIWIDCQP